MIQRSNPKVSIIILSYNQASYIEDAINSALDQTYENIEIIISDNGSTDSTKQIIKKFASDPKIITLDYPENQSISLRQNQAAKAASGEFISLLYADDYYLPIKIEHQVKIFSTLSDDWGVVHGPGKQLIEETGNFKKLSSTKAHDLCLKKLFQDYSDGFIVPIAPLVRAKVYLEFPLYEDIFSEGESLYWRIATKYRFFYSDLPTVVMRYHKKNMGKAIRKNMEMHLICLDRLIMSKEFPEDSFSAYHSYRSKIIFANVWHCFRTNFEIMWAKKLIVGSVVSYPKSALNLKYIPVLFYIFMPKKLIFYINKMINFIFKKKLFVPLEDYYH